MNVIWKFLALLWWFWTHRVSTLSSEIIHCKILSRVAAVAFAWMIYILYIQAYVIICTSPLSLFEIMTMAALPSFTDNHER